MLGSTVFQSGAPGQLANQLEVCLPIMESRINQDETAFWRMVCFAQEMRETETDIECRLAEMGNFVVKQDQFILINQNVLRTEIPVNECFLPAERVGNQRAEKRLSGRHYDRTVFVVRFQAQCAEKRSIQEFRSEFGRLGVRPLMDQP